MNKYSLMEKCQDKLIEISSLDGTIESRINALRDIESVVESSEFLGFDIDFSIIERSGAECVIYKFYDGNNNLCSGAMKISYESFADDFVHEVETIANGVKALEVINEAIANHPSNIDGEFNIEYTWGVASSCAVVYWDFGKIVLRTSRKAIENIAMTFAIGAATFSDYVEADIANIDFKELNAAKYVAAFDAYPLNIRFGATMTNDGIGSIMCKNMLNEEDALEIIKANNGTNGYQNIIIARVIDQLGKFIVLQNLRVDYNNKTITESIVDNKLIDLEELSIVTNGAIISRVGQVIKISDSKVREALK